MSRNGDLLVGLVGREIAGRYRGSLLGMLWSLITPLMMLAVYTVVFGGIFKSRWQVPGREAADQSIAEFAIVLFAGLTIFHIFADVINEASGLVLANANFVKKVVFPLEILVPVALGTALFHAAVSMVILLVFEAIFMGGVPWTALILPVTLLPLCLMVLGLGWALAALGTYLRDIGQVVGTVVTALMFLSPVFFQRSTLPAQVQGLIVLNPLTIPIEAARDVLLWGNLPDFAALALYGLVALAVAAGGYLFFQKTRKGFADVL